MVSQEVLFELTHELGSSRLCMIHRAQFARIALHVAYNRSDSISVEEVERKRLSIVAEPVMVFVLHAGISDLRAVALLW